MMTCTPEEGYLLEEQGREIATLVKRLANAELLIEKLKEDVGHWEEDFAMFDRAHKKAIDLWRKEHPDAGYTPDMSDLNEWMVRRVEKYKEAAPFLAWLQSFWRESNNFKEGITPGFGTLRNWVWENVTNAPTAEESPVMVAIMGCAGGEEDGKNGC